MTLTVPQLYDRVAGFQADHIRTHRLPSPELWTIAKLSEETGEVAAAALRALHMSRNHEGGSLGPELADVIMCALALGALFDIDMEQELECKLKIVEERFTHDQ